MAERANPNQPHSPAISVGQALAVLRNGEVVRKVAVAKITKRHVVDSEGTRWNAVTQYKVVEPMGRGALALAQAEAQVPSESLALARIRSRVYRRGVRESAAPAAADLGGLLEHTPWS